MPRSELGVPTRGSATVLNTYAAVGSLSVQCSSTGSPAVVSAMMAASCSELGSSLRMLNSSISSACRLTALPQNTGVIRPSLTPLRMPSTISSVVNGSPPKNFSISSSSVSAMASLMASIRPWNRWPMSGRSIWICLPPSYLKAFWLNRLM